ncbi:focadhesin isoform X2 [Danaus plexippus]|uniref:focadhesin isoform X2 n=1 Tax=Danaus plexippus TaxID=13037 RepID=UPI002AB2B02A|nr:focadhesin isoform X2 [Danaus plexippus]
MDEIEYKLNTNNSVLIVNAIDKLILTIKSKFKPGERQKFVLENEELKFLREKCSSKDNMVSLTACQGLLALVELGVLEIAHTMSTVVTLIPSTHNYSAIISTMAGLLILDLKSRLIPGQPYKCQFSMRSPQHPFITILQKNKDIEDNVIAQMHALCTHPEYIVASNSLELLRPVFLWLTCSPQASNSIKPWQLLISLPESAAQINLLVACLSCQQIRDAPSCERSFSVYRCVSEGLRSRPELGAALLAVIARTSGELMIHGMDPRPCYSLVERVLSEGGRSAVAGLVIMMLGGNLVHTSALYLHELFHLCLNIITKYEFSTLCLNSFVALSLQWLHLPSYLTNNALKVSSKILEIHQSMNRPDSGLFMANMKNNAVFQEMVHVDRKLYIHYKLLDTWERLRDEPDRLSKWFDGLMRCDDRLKVELMPFIAGLALDGTGDERLVLAALQGLIQLVGFKKEVSVTLLPILLYKIANDPRAKVKLECLRGLPLMATTKENVPALVSIFNKLKNRKGVPTSQLIMMYTSLAETQVRCFPYLQELLSDSSLHPHDLKWEVDIAKALAVRRICEIRPSSHGLELVPVVSSLLNRWERSSAGPVSLALEALRHLWQGAAVAPPGTWRALQPRLAKDNRIQVQISLCNLLAEAPALRVSSAEYGELLQQTAARLWLFISDSDQPAVIGAACRALAGYKIEDYTLKDIPEVYRRTVKLPPSYCKTPSDAARKPEDVLDYLPCEVWPEVFKYTNQSALHCVQHLVSKLIGREIRGYRSGVYHEREGGKEGAGLSVSSVLRGVVEGLRKQMVSPTYDYSDAVLLAMLETLSSEFPKPLPPFDLTFLHEGLHRGAPMRARVVKLAARQASTAVSAKRLIENFLSAIDPGNCEESDILLFFEYLPILCRTMPPNHLRPPLERCLSDSFSRVRVKGQEETFIKQLNYIKECLDCDKIHDANRTLLSQLVESYFTVIDEDHVAWSAYLAACSSLVVSSVERMSSPSSWWEVSGALLRKASVLRARLAANRLVWINEIVDTAAGHVTEQEFTLRCFLPALQATDVDATNTREWFLQLMARTQVAFKETEEESARLYLCDVFFLSVVVFSGLWTLEADGEALVADRDARLGLAPAALGLLVDRDGWTDYTAQLLEWLCHTRSATRHAGVSRCCRRSVLALRHTRAFHEHAVLMKLWNDVQAE